MYILLCLLVLVIHPRGYQQFNTKSLSPEEYGPYQLDATYFRMCKGPKRENMTSGIVTVTKTPENTYTLSWNVTFLIAGPIEELKSSVYTYNKKLLYNYKVKNLCKHALGPLINHELHTDSGCVVKKGNYFVKIYLTNVTTMFLGSKFFYGDFVFKHIVTSRKGNVICGDQGIRFSKKIVI